MADENVYGIDVSGALTSLAALQKALAGTNKSIRDLSVSSAKYSKDGQLIVASFNAITEAGKKANIVIKPKVIVDDNGVERTVNSISSLNFSKPTESLDKLSRSTQAVLANIINLSQQTDKVKIPEIRLKTPTIAQAGLNLTKENVTFGDADELAKINKLVAEFIAKGKEAGIGQKRLNAAIGEGDSAVKSLIGDHKNLAITYDLLKLKAANFANQAAKAVKIPHAQEVFGATTEQITKASPTETRSLKTDITKYLSLQTQIEHKQLEIANALETTKTKKEQEKSLEEQLANAETRKEKSSINKEIAQIQREITKETKATNAEIAKTTQLEAKLLALTTKINQSVLNLGAPKYEKGALEASLGATRSKLQNASPEEVSKLNSELVKFINLTKTASQHDIAYAINNAGKEGEHLVGIQGQIAKQFIAARNAANELGQEVARTQAIANRSSQVNRIFNKVILPKLPSADLDYKTSSGTNKEIDEAKTKAKSLTDFLVANVKKGKQSIEKAFEDLATLAKNPNYQVKSPFTKEFLGLFVEAHNAYNRVGLSAAEAAEKQRKFNREIIVGVRQQINTYEELANAIAESKVQTERLKSTVLSNRNIAPEVREDPRYSKQIANYTREFGTIDTTAAKFLLVADDVDKITAAFHSADTTFLEGRADLNAVYTSLTTFASSYDRLTEKINKATLAQKAEAEAVRVALELEKHKAAVTASTNVQRKNITTELFNQLPPVQSEISSGTFHTNINEKQLSQIRTKILEVNDVLKSVEIEDIKVGQAFELAFSTKSLDELVGRISALDPATRKVYNALYKYRELIDSINAESLNNFNKQTTVTTQSITAIKSRTSKIIEEGDITRQTVNKFLEGEAKKEAATAQRVQKEREAGVALLSQQKERALIAVADSVPRQQLIAQAQAQAPNLDTLDDEEAIVLANALGKVNTVLEKTNVDISITRDLLKTAFTSNFGELKDAIISVDPLLRPALNSFREYRQTVDRLKTSVNQYYEEFKADGPKIEAELEKERAKLEAIQNKYNDVQRALATKEAATKAASDASIRKLQDEINKANELKAAFRNVVQPQFEKLAKPIDKGLVGINSDQLAIVNKALGVFDSTLDQTKLDGQQLINVFKAFNGDNIVLVTAEERKLLDVLNAVKKAYNDVYLAESNASARAITDSDKTIAADIKKGEVLRKTINQGVADRDRTLQPARTERARQFLTSRPELQFGDEVPVKIQTKISTSQIDVSQQFAKSGARALEFTSLFDEAFNRAGEAPSALALKFGPLYKSLTRLSEFAAKAGESFTKSFTGVAAPVQKEISDLVIKSKIDLDVLKKALKGLDISITSPEIDKLKTKIKDLDTVVASDAKAFEKASGEIVSSIQKEIEADNKRAKRLADNEAKIAKRKSDALASQAESDKKIGAAFPDVVKQFVPEGKTPSFKGTKEQILEVREAFVSLTQQIVKTGEPISGLRAKLELLKANREALAKGKILELPPVSTQTEALNQSLLRVHDSLTAAGEAGSKAGQRITLSFQGLLRLLQVQVLHTFIFNIISEFQQAITASGEFEQKVALVRTIADESAGTFDNWAKSIREVSDLLGKPSVEIATAAYDSLSNQITNSVDDTKRFLTVAGEFSRITGSSVPDSVNLLSSAINSFGLNSSDAERVAAGFFATIDKGRVKANELANNFGRTSAFANTLGVSLSEVEAGLVVITQAGVKSAEAQTQLNAIFSKLIKPTEDLQKLLTSLGIASGEELIRARGLGGAIQFLAEAAREGKIEITDIFNEIRGSKGFFTLAQNGAESFSKALKDVQPSSDKFRHAIEEFDKPAGVQLQKSLQKIKNYITDDLGRAGVEALVHFSNTFGGIDNNFKLLITVVGEATKAIALFGAASAAAFVVNKLEFQVAGLVREFISVRQAATLAGSSINVFTASAVVAQNSVKGLSASITAFIAKNPYLVAFTAGFAGVSAVLHYAKKDINDLTIEYDKNKEAAIKNSQEIAQAIAENAAHGTDAIKKNLDEQLKLYTNQTIEIRKALQDQLDSQKDISKELGGQLGNAFKSTLDQLKEGTDNIKKQAEDASKSVEDIRKSQTDRGQEIEKKEFQRKVTLYPRSEVPLTLQRVDKLSDQATNFFNTGNVSEGLQAFREADQLIDNLLDKFPKAIALRQKLVDSFNERSRTANSKIQNPALSNAIANFRNKQFEPTNEDIISKKTADQRSRDIKRISDLTISTNRRNYNAQIEAQSRIRNINAKYNQVNQDTRPSIEQALINLTQRELLIKEQVIKANQEQAHTLKQNASIQELLSSEAQRFFTEANKVTVYDKSGKLLSQEDRNKAVERVLDFKNKTLEAVEAIVKAQSRIFDKNGEPIIDPKLLDETIKRFETLFDAKISSLTKEASIARDIDNVEKFNNAVIEGAQSGVKAVEELNKQYIALGNSINNAAAALSNDVFAANKATQSALSPSVGQKLGNLIPFSGILDTSIPPVATAYKEGAIRHFEPRDQLLNALSELESVQTQYAKVKDLDIKITVSKTTLERVKDDLIKTEEEQKKLNVLTIERDKIGNVVTAKDVEDKSTKALDALNKLRDVRKQIIETQNIKGVDADAAGKIDVLGKSLRYVLETTKILSAGIRGNEREANQLIENIAKITEVLENPIGKSKELNKAIQDINFKNQIGEARDFANAIEELIRLQQQYNQLLKESKPDNKYNELLKGAKDKTKASSISGPTGLLGVLSSTAIGQVKGKDNPTITADLISNTSLKIAKNIFLPLLQIITKQREVPKLDNKSITEGFNKDNYKNEAINFPQLEQNQAIPFPIAMPNSGILTLPPTIDRSSENKDINGIIQSIDKYVTKNSKSKPFDPQPIDKTDLSFDFKGLIGHLNLEDIFHVDQLKDRIDAALAEVKLPPATKEQVRDLAQALNIFDDIGINFREDQGRPKYNDTDALIEKTSRQLNKRYPQQAYPENDIALAANGKVAKIDLTKIFNFEQLKDAFNKALSEIKLPKATDEQARNFEGALRIDDKNSIKLPNSINSPPRNEDLPPKDKPAEGLPNLIDLETAFKNLEKTVDRVADSLSHLSMPQSKRYGGPIYLNKGGRVNNPLYLNKGGLVPAMLAKGEMVIPPEIAKNNMATLNRMNYFSNGGFVPRGLDTIPTLLPQGSYVLNPRATQNFTPIVRASQTSYRNTTSTVRTDSNTNSFGDIHINMNNATKTNVMQFAQELKRAARQGRINL